MRLKEIAEDDTLPHVLIIHYQLRHLVGFVSIRVSGQENNLAKADIEGQTLVNIMLSFRLRLSDRLKCLNLIRPTCK